MKLKLEKQKVATLSSKEMGNVNGGGRRRSMRITNFGGGSCRYSRNHEVGSTNSSGQYAVVCY